MDLTLPSQWIIEAEPWQWLTIGTPGLLASWWLYGRRGSAIERKTTGGGIGIGSRVTLGVLRWVAFTVLSFLLLEPLLRETEIEKEGPVAIVLLDQSSSILGRNNPMKNVGQEENAEALGKWMKELDSELTSTGLETEWYGFDRDLYPLFLNDPDGFKWQGTQTNLSRSIADLNNRIENRNIAGLLIATDGLINRGGNPEYGISWPLAPIHTIGLGDTTRYEDRWIARVNHNQVAYLNNTFPVEAVVYSQGMEGQEGMVRIFKGAEEIGREEWVCDSKQDVHKVKFMLPASEIGTVRYSITASEGEMEFDTENNRRNFYVDILESRRIITCIAAAPHPDLGAISMALDALEAYECQTIYPDGKSTPVQILQALEASDVIIAHNLIGTTWQGRSWSSLIEANNASAWWLATTEQSYDALRAKNDLGVRLTGSPNLNQAFQSRINASYGLIDFDQKKLGSSLSSWPPMNGPFGSLSWTPAWTPLLYKQLGSLETQEAFWSTKKMSSGARYAMTIGEGLWNWRMRNYLRTNSHDTFNELIQRHLQYLASNDNRERFNIQSESRISSDMNIQFTAEAYDASWNMSRNAKIDVVLSNQNQEEFVKTLNYSDGRYILDFGKMPEGQYKWSATCAIDRENFLKSGKLVVEETQLESTSQPANHELLRRISSANGGKFIGDRTNTSPTAAAAALTSTGIPATIRHEQISLQNGLEWWPLLLFALLLLTIEWIVRRRNLGY